MCKSQWNSIPCCENSKWMLAVCLKSQLDLALRFLHHQSSALLTLIWAFLLVWFAHSNTSVVQTMPVPFSPFLVILVPRYLIDYSFFSWSLCPSGALKSSLGSFFWFFFFLKCLPFTHPPKNFLQCYLRPPSTSVHIVSLHSRTTVVYLKISNLEDKSQRSFSFVLILPIFVEQLCARFCCRYWVYSHEQRNVPFLWNLHFSRGGKQ